MNFAGGKKPLSASIMVQKYLRPTAVKTGVIKVRRRPGSGGQSGEAVEFDELMAI
jgi:hypothetical protein